MTSMILAKKFIFSISRSFPQTQSLFLRSSSSSPHKFSIATFTAFAKEKLTETGERTTVVLSQKDRKKENAHEMKETTKTKAEKDIERRSVADKAKTGSYKAIESLAQEAMEEQKHWKKPPKRWHVLSTDGSVREDIAGIGGLIRDDNGSIVEAFAAGIPIAPIHVIEIKAIVEGVKISISNKITKLIINSDSMIAVKVMNGRMNTPCEATDDLKWLDSMKSCFTGFEVIHVCRELNKPADFLASFCKDVNGTLVFNSVNSPQRLKFLAAQDAMDVTN